MFLALLAPIAAEADSRRLDSGIIVKYRSDGPHALEECAERISRKGGTFEAHLRDRSDSLDLLAARYEIRRHRALFRRATGEPLDAQRRAMRARWAAARAKYPRGNARTSGSATDWPDLAHVYRAEIPEGQDARQLIAALNADPHVEYAQLDHRIELDQVFVPNDPFFHSEGSWGQAHADLWGPERIRAPEAWTRSQGEGAIVAVVDTGLDDLHPDIIGNVWVNPGEDVNGNGVADASDRNGLDDDGNGFIDDLTGFDFANSVDIDEDGFYASAEDIVDADPFDDDGHGSHVAGTIAAVGDNGIGIIGIAPRAKLMALKGFAAGAPGSDAVLWRAVLYAAEMGATVVNNSWSCGTPCPDNPLADEVLTLVDALGMVVVTSAGNARDDVVFRNPENGRRVISVGALGVDDRLANFSNRGWLMDVVAPGGGPEEPFTIPVARRNILSLLSSGALFFREFFAVGDDYFRFAGTSMSAPHVAGAVAVLRSLRPELSPSDVRRLVRMSASDLGRPGHDATFGAGVLDVARLLETELPDLELSIESPAPGTILDPSDGPVYVIGQASGRDLLRIEVDVGRGLNARTFTSIDALGNAMTRASARRGWPDGALAHWDVSTAADGPYVLRLRAWLRDGRMLEEHTVVSLERNRPQRLSRGDRPVSRPDLSGRRIVWQARESEPQENGFFASDLELGFFPRSGRGRHRPMREPFLLLEREGEQRNPMGQGREFVWEEVEAGTPRFERCRLEPGTDRCAPKPVSTDPGRLFQLHLGRDRLVWMRNDGGVIELEGCAIGAREDECVPRSLLADDAGAGWLLTSFDGSTLLLRRGLSERARCRLASADDGLCHPESVTFGDGLPTIVEVVHDRSLVAFQTLSVESRLPPGCPEVDPTLGCEVSSTPVAQLYACWLPETATACEARPVTASVPSSSLVGFDVSRQRITWAIERDDDRSAIHFCQFVPETLECVDQRLGGSAAPQTRPSIDSTRIVWEDRRVGATSVFGFEVPGLALRRDARVRAGRPFHVAFRGFPGSGGDLHFEAEALEGVAPEEARVRFRAVGRRSNVVILSGWMPPNASGVARWRIRATGPGGLFADRVLKLTVDDRRRR